jgi:hypothetical protein
MPGDYPPGSSGGSWDRRTLKPRGRSGGPMNEPGFSGRRPVPPPPPPPGRSGMRQPYGPNSAPGASGAQRTLGPYRGMGAPAPQSYDPFAASMPGLGMRTSAHLEAIQRKRNGFALFHDGNAGHLWRGEVASLLGDSMLSIGVIIWLAYLTGSPLMTLLAVLALGLPWLIAIPIAPFFENVRDPGRPLAWIGRLRIVAALGVVGMHFLTIYPILFGILLLIGLTGRIRQALRVAATRACLEPGEVELVANDLFIGSALTTVIGPLLAAALFMVMGERIILIGLASAALFLLASNSDGFLDTLPEERRAFTLATPTSATPDEATRADLIAAARGVKADVDADSDADAEVDNSPDSDDAPLTPEQRERALPEWYQQGPRNPFQAIADVRAGLALAGGRAASASALLTLTALALAGGGLSVLEVFYVSDRLGLAGYYFGVLAALEAGGLTLGAMLAELPPARRNAGPPALLGLALTGVALSLLAWSTIPTVSYGGALLLGVANGMSVTAGRRLLRAGYDGAERRALSAGEAFLTALASVGGAVFFTVFYAGSMNASVGTRALFPGMPLGMVLGGAGVGLILAGAILFVRPGLRDRAPKSAKSDKDSLISGASGRMAAAPGASGRFASPVGASGKMGAIGATGAVGALWANHEDDEDDSAYTGERGRAYDDEEEPYEDDDRFEDEYEEDEEERDDWDRRGRGRGAPPKGGRPPLGPRVRPPDRRGRW